MGNFKRATEHGGDGCYMAGFGFGFGFELPDPFSTMLLGACRGTFTSVSPRPQPQAGPPTTHATMLGHGEPDKATCSSGRHRFGAKSACVLCVCTLYKKMRNGSGIHWQQNWQQGRAHCKPSTPIHPRTYLARVKWATTVAMDATWLVLSSRTLSLSRCWGQVEL
jgi:hypothetical protein